MDDHDRAQRRVEVEEGHHARQLLTNPLFQAIWTDYEAALVGRMSDPNSGDDKVLEARRMLIALRKVRAEIETAAVTGDLALQQLEEDNDGRGATAKH